MGSRWDNPRPLAPLPRWGQPGDGQGARVLILVALLAATILTIVILDGDKGEPARYEKPIIAEIHTCKVEDEVVVEVAEDAFDLSIGDLRCAHIDALVPTEENP